MFFLNLDIAALAAVEDGLRPAVEKAMREAGQRLTTATHGHILEEVQQKLKSSRQKYVDALNYEQIGDNAWVIRLEPQAFFIEEGLPSNWEMIDDLLKQGRPDKSRLEGQPRGEIKTSKEGHRYRSIPFEQNKGPSSQTPMQKSMTDMVKAEMKSRGIPYGKIEKDEKGAPKQGLLHSFDVVKRSRGAGSPVGKQGPQSLQGVRVYQTKVKDKQGKDTIKRGIFTFRTVSSKQKGSGKWVHPGLEARKFMDEAFQWAVKLWEDKIGPDVVRQVMEGI